MVKNGSWFLCTCLPHHDLTSAIHRGCLYSVEGKEARSKVFSCCCFYTADDEEEGGKGSRAGGGCPHCGVPASAPAQGTGLPFPSLPFPSILFHQAISVPFASESLPFASESLPFAMPSGSKCAFLLDKSACLSAISGCCLVLKQ